VPLRASGKFDGFVQFFCRTQVFFSSFYLIWEA